VCGLEAGKLPIRRNIVRGPNPPESSQHPVIPIRSDHTHKFVLAVLSIKYVKDSIEALPETTLVWDS